MKICKTGQSYVFLIVVYPLPGPGTGPTRFISKIRAILGYLCVRRSDVVSNVPWDNSLLMCKKWGSRPATIWLTQSFNRNEKDAQSHLKPGTPNIRPGSFFCICFMPHMCFCRGPLVKFQNTKRFLNQFRQPYPYPNQGLVFTARCTGPS